MEFIVIFFAISYAIVACQLGHRVALRRVPILFACLAAALVGIFAVHRLLPSEWEDYAWSGFLLLFSFYMGIYLAVSLKRRAQAGDTLLEIGRPRGGLVIGVVGTSCGLFVGASSILKAITDGQPEIARQIRDISSGLFWVTLSALILLVWLSKGSIRERGIMVNGQILKWEKIQGFHWDKDKPCTLALKVKRRFLWWRTLYVPVPLDRREAATEILECNLPEDAAGGSTG